MRGRRIPHSFQPHLSTTGVPLLMRRGTLGRGQAGVVRESKCLIARWVAIGVGTVDGGGDGGDGGREEGDGGHGVKPEIGEAGDNMSAGAKGREGASVPMRYVSPKLGRDEGEALCEEHRGRNTRGGSRRWCIAVPLDDKPEESSAMMNPGRTTSQPGACSGGSGCRRGLAGKRVAVRRRQHAGSAEQQVACLQTSRQRVLWRRCTDVLARVDEARSAEGDVEDAGPRGQVGADELGGRRRAADNLNAGKGGLGEPGEDTGKSSRVDQVELRKTRVRDKYQHSSMIVADTNSRSAGKCMKAYNHPGDHNNIVRQRYHVGVHKCGHPDGRRTKIWWTKASSQGSVSEGQDWGTAAHRRGSVAEMGLPGGDKTIRCAGLMIVYWEMEALRSTSDHGGPFPKRLPAPVHPEWHLSTQLGHGKSTKKIATQEGVTKASQRSQPEGIA
ncbi:hypothetical protein B0H14DRAFT_2623866 [Mycena olivaceomarginata]|nr:hypothetical protein B0H14DRAFT_2623866 [Mycena olivaceomarginata]